MPVRHGVRSTALSSTDARAPPVSAPYSPPILPRPPPPLSWRGRILPSLILHMGSDEVRRSPCPALPSPALPCLWAPPGQGRAAAELSPVCLCSTGRHVRRFSPEHTAVWVRCAVVRCGGSVAVCRSLSIYGYLCMAAGSHTPGVIPICMSAAPHTERRLLGALGPMGSG